MRISIIAAIVFALASCGHHHGGGHSSGGGGSSPPPLPPITSTATLVGDYDGTRVAFWATPWAPDATIVVHVMGAETLRITSADGSSFLSTTATMTCTADNTFQGQLSYHSVPWYVVLTRQSDGAVSLVAYSYTATGTKGSPAAAFTLTLQAPISRG